MTLLVSGIRSSNSYKQKVEQWFPENGERGRNRKTLCNGYRISILQDLRVQESGFRAMWQCEYTYHRIMYF
jgi:hypothetical protein